MKKSILVVLTAAVALAFGVSTYAEEKKAEAKPAEKAAPAAEKKAEAKPAEKKPVEKTVNGTVEKGKADGSWVIKAGKKTYDVDAASPKFADVAPLAGKAVQAKGEVKKGEKGAMSISVTEIKEAPAKAEKKAEKKEEAKPAEKK